MQSHRLADAGAKQKQTDDAGALNRPKRIGVKVLPDEAGVVQVEAKMKCRHPDDGRAAQRVEAVEALNVSGLWSLHRVA